MKTKIESAGVLMGKRIDRYYVLENRYDSIDLIIIKLYEHHCIMLGQRVRGGDFYKCNVQFNMGFRRHKIINSYSRKEDLLVAYPELI